MTSLAAKSAEHTRIAHNLLLEAELKTLCKTLNDRGIPVIVMKGIPLARRVFGGLAGRKRYQCDNDLLVRRADFQSACEALSQIGYCPRPFRAMPPHMDAEFQVPLFRQIGDSSVVAEVHWGAFPPLLYPVPEEIVWRHSEPFTISGVTLRVFDPALTLLHLASHFVQHNGVGFWILEDFAAAWRRFQHELDVSDLVDLARQLKLDHTLAYTVSAAEHLGMLSGDVPRVGSRRAAFLRHILPPSQANDARLAHNYTRLLAMTLLAEPARIPRWFYFQVFPPIQLMTAIYKEQISPKLYARYGTRLFRPFWRKLKGNRDAEHV